MTPAGWMATATVGLAVLAIARGRRWLTTGGGVAAGGVGVAIGAGLGAAGLVCLLAFFVSSSWLTATLRRRRDVVSAGAASRPATEPDDDARGRRAGQVLANAGAAVACALLAPVVPEALAEAGAAGALAAATADTWASEVGQWRRAPTRLVTSGRRVAPGTSGGVSWAGSGAGAAGAIGLALVAGASFAAPGLTVSAAAGGLAGMLVDSIAGATLERRIGWVGNDLVNWLGTGAGAAVAAVLAWT